MGSAAGAAASVGFFAGAFFAAAVRAGFFAATIATFFPFVWAVYAARFTNVWAKSHKAGRRPWFRAAASV